MDEMEEMTQEERERQTTRIKQMSAEVTRALLKTFFEKFEVDESKGEYGVVITSVTVTSILNLLLIVMRAVKADEVKDDIFKLFCKSLEEIKGRFAGAETYDKAIDKMLNLSAENFN